MSPWRSRPKNDDATAKAETKKLDGTSTISSGDSDRKGIWKWKPIRALSHIGMQKLSCSSGCGGGVLFVKGFAQSLQFFKELCIGVALGICHY